MRQFKKFTLPVLLLVTVAIGSLCLLAMRTLALNSLTGVGKPDVVTAVPESPVVHKTNLRATAAALSPIDDDKAFWLTIRPTGFEPSEITVPAGEYFVIIQNATGLNQFALRVAREGGGDLLNVRLPFRRRYWKHTVNLQPGSFIVSEADHPEWKCRITVTGQ